VKTSKPAWRSPPTASASFSQNLIHTDDRLIWAFAQAHGFTIVSKDADFHQRSLVLGQPPKLIFLPVGNCATHQITELLRANFAHISAFGLDPNTSIMVLPTQPKA
jgi:predicted nuclease of predicted toxin-antitoxin system